MSTYGRVSKWNAKCGKTPEAAGTPQYYEALSHQLQRIMEEANEALAAIEQGNILEVIDAGLDLDVVVAGYNYLAGGDYDAGIALVLGNNDLKVTKSKKKAKNWLAYHIDNGVAAYLNESVIGSQTFYCVRRQDDGKILKPANFPKVDLTPVCPEIGTLVMVLLENPNTTKYSAEQIEYFEKTGTQPIYLSNFDKEDEATYAVMEHISKEAEGKGAFVYIQNGTVVGAEKFTIEGPTVEGED